MSSGRLILIFLGFILLVIVLLSSNRISTALKNRFGGLFPSLKLSSQLTPTPSQPPLIKDTGPSPSISDSSETGTATKGAVSISPTSKTPDEIPSTGASETLWFFLGGSAIIGILFKKLSVR